MCCGLAALAGCAETSCNTASTKSEAAQTAPPPPAAPEKRNADVKPPSSIGSATMKPDGTIVLQLRATDGTGIVGDSRVEYAPSHAQYADVLKHLGGLKPGQEKPVPPWPE
jgi:hypothetical protein